MRTKTFISWPEANDIDMSFVETTLLVSLSSNLSECMINVKNRSLM